MNKTPSGLALDRRRFLVGVAGVCCSYPWVLDAGADPQKRAPTALTEFTDILAQFHRDPTLATTSRDANEMSDAFRVGLERAPIRSPKSTTELSARASDLIVYCEITNELTYKSKYEKPSWPGGNSGVTIGIGYDLGYTTPFDLKADWGAYIDNQTLNSLSEACGLTGSGAGDFLAQLSAIRIDWKTALSQYAHETLPRCVGATESALTNTKSLSPDSLGALVSLVYNRGASFRLPGSHYEEMRNIKTHMDGREFNKIPAELQSMKRLWPDSKGLVLRREAEAALFQLGLS